jgi:hypothetical protein
LTKLDLPANFSLSCLKLFTTDFRSGKIPSVEINVFLGLNYQFISFFVAVTANHVTLAGYGCGEAQPRDVRSVSLGCGGRVGYPPKLGRTARLGQKKIAYCHLSHISSYSSQGRCSFRRALLDISLQTWHTDAVYSVSSHSLSPSNVRIVMIHIIGLPFSTQMSYNNDVFH